MTVLALVSCESHSRAESVPAIVVDPTEDTRQELRSVVMRMLNGAPVTLAADALTASSLLTVERKPRPGLQGSRPATGRMMERPEQFRLVRSNGECVLVHVRTGERATLTRAD